MPTSGPGAATVRFRRDQVSSGLSRLGRLRPAGLLRIEYDPLRLLGDDEPREVSHLRFEPSGEQRSTLLQFPVSVAQARPGMSKPAAYEIAMPDDASVVELWFERRGPNGADGWDSRFGRNYRFSVSRDGLPTPDASVALRPDAVVDPSRISVVDDAALKAQQAISARGSALSTELKISAKITGGDDSTLAWADFHIFDATDDVIHVGTLELQGPEASSEPTIVQTWSATCIKAQAVVPAQVCGRARTRIRCNTVCIVRCAVVYLPMAYCTSLICRPMLRCAQYRAPGRGHGSRSALAIPRCDSCNLFTGHPREHLRSEVARRSAGCNRANMSMSRATSPVQPVWWLAPSPAPLSPWKYS